MQEIPTDIKRLLLFETQPKAFLALSSARKDFSRICLEPRYLRVKQEWSRHVTRNYSGDHIVYDQVFPNGTIDGIRYVSYRGVCLDEKSQWRNGKQHGVSDEHYDDRPSYCFYINGKQEGIRREWNYVRDTYEFPRGPSDYFLENEEFRINGNWIWYRQYDSNGNVIDSQG